MTKLRSAFLHLRWPISIFLVLPFVMSFALSPSLGPRQSLLIFFILHFLIYPASNGHNSYYDKDTQSIGALRNPPPVSRELFWLSWILDGIGFLLSLNVSLHFAFGVFVYSFFSQIYSHPSIRLKKYPWKSFFTVIFFQGAWIVFLIRVEAVGSVNQLTKADFGLMALSSLYLVAGYPLSQIYQHESDKKRGDLTLSRWLGLQRTWTWNQFFSGLSLLITELWVFQTMGLLAASWTLIGFFILALVLRQQNFLGPLSQPPRSQEQVMRIQWISIFFLISIWTFICFFKNGAPYL